MVHNAKQFCLGSLKQKERLLTSTGRRVGSSLCEYVTWCNKKHRIIEKSMLELASKSHLISSSLLLKAELSSKTVQDPVHLE